ncbi:FxSxx-COOH cyclophane-containing RiPP peptide [Streptomyces sviceus]|uniref:FxSxx-COOH cyclophane-containing RiPP peptide n=1 Tax=Streptomyces sviceus TaxID=285530 RepID=UPI0033333452
MDTPINDPAEESKKQSSTGERVPLVRLAARSDCLRSGALTRVLSHGTPDRGPSRIRVAAFQSAV